MIWKDSVRKDGPPGGKMRHISNTISLLSSILSRTVDELSVSVFDDLGVPGKLAMSSSECHKPREKSSLGL